MIISNIMTSTLNFNKLLDSTKLKVQVSNWILKPLLAALGGATFSKLILNLCFHYNLATTPILILALILSSLIYLLLLFIIDCLRKEDFIKLTTLLHPSYEE